MTSLHDNWLISYPAQRDRLAREGMYRVEDEHALDGAEHVVRYQSSARATRSFCGTCGSTLWYRYRPDGKDSGNYEVPVGLLDDLSGLKLVKEIFVDEKPGGYALAGDLKRLTGAEVMAQFSGGEG